MINIKCFKREITVKINLQNTGTRLGDPSAEIAPIVVTPVNGALRLIDSVIALCFSPFGIGLVILQAVILRGGINSVLFQKALSQQMVDF